MAKTVPIRIIGVGRGSSGYYSADVLKKSIGAFPRGTRIYSFGGDEADHDGTRNVQSWAGTIESTPRFIENHSSGIPGIYANAAIYDDHAYLIDKKAELSINAAGAVKEQEIDGKRQRVVTKIAPSIHNTIEAVNYAGAKGSILTESAQRQLISDCPECITESISFIEADDMSQELKEKLEKLEEKSGKQETVLAALLKENKALKSAAAVDTAIAEAGTPAEHVAFVKRLVLAEGVPMTDNGVDTEKLAEAVKNATPASTAPAKPATSDVSFITGLGESATGTAETDLDALFEAYKGA